MKFHGHSPASMMEANLWKIIIERKCWFMKQHYEYHYTRFAWIHSKFFYFAYSCLEIFEIRSKIIFKHVFFLCLYVFFMRTLYKRVRPAPRIYNSYRSWQTLKLQKRSEDKCACTPPNVEGLKIVRVEKREAGREF